MDEGTGAASRCSNPEARSQLQVQKLALRTMRVSWFKAEQNLNGQPIYQEIKKLRRKKSFGLILELTVFARLAFTPLTQKP
jgi:hypothetical protein